MPQELMTGNELKARILYEFVKELIHNSGEGRVHRLEKVIADKKEEQKYQEQREKEKVKEEVRDREEERKAKEEGKKKEPELKDIVKKKSMKKFKPLPGPRSVRAPRAGNVPPEKRVLRIPAPRLPPRFNYLRPTPTKKNLELGKLNPLVNDPGVKSIECHGPNTEIFVSGSMGRKKTNIMLNEEEIESVIDTFSKETKIPVNEGVYKVVAGNLMFSAIISNVTNTRFIIRKIPPSPPQAPRGPPPRV